ncbi:hypothetical protein ACEYW6_33910 [Nostoc sp. UIC 10607]|uniref:hypothetical protein n=1 Tax=Nostoc foliaceum TaxID=2692914 RepID=UPI001F5564DE|nr:hypothetical protein [Nostoc foliaceum]
MSTSSTSKTFVLVYKFSSKDRNGRNKRMRPFINKELPQAKQFLTLSGLQRCVQR